MNTRFFNERKLSEAELLFYRDQGYLVIRNILTEAGLEEMREQSMKAWVAEKGAFDENKTWLQNALLVNVHHKAPVVRDYYFQGPLVDIAEQLIGQNLKGATSQLTFKMRGNTKPFGWHQDNGYGELDPYNALTTLTALDDTDSSNGCLWLIPGSHRQG
ncbi:MAG TPA: phytanoyl-CoA dioxygenase family protein, partial [Chryseosolibacter sp.]|nr:phytanoyl-CoA dioxygenase family protein [Chryseosolibacter sp.]